MILIKKIRIPKIPRRVKKRKAKEGEKEKVRV